MCSTVQFSRTIVLSVFDCGMGCMDLFLLVKVWVLLKLQSIVFLQDCLPAVSSFSSTISFSFFRFPAPKKAWGSLNL